MHRSLVIALFAGSALAQAPGSAGKETPRAALIVAVVAAQNQEAAKTQAASLSGFIGNALKETAVSRVYPDQESLALAVAKSEVDYAFIGPLAYLRIDPKSRSQLVFRALRNGKATYRSALFAPAGKKTTIETLRKGTGLKVAWVEPSSASGYLLGKAHLIKAGINPVQIFTVQDFLGSHDAVCKAVAEGKYDLGATFSDPAPGAPRLTGCESALGKGAAKLTQVAITDEVPTDVLVAAPHIKRERLEVLRTAGRTAPSSEAGKEALKAAFLADGVADVIEADFEPVRAAIDAFSP